MPFRRMLPEIIAVAASLAFATPLLAVFAVTDCYIPSTGRGPGKQGSQWYTTVWVYNPNQTEASIQLAFHERDKSNTAPLVHNEVLPPGGIRKYGNAVSTLFGVEKFGAIRVVSDVRVVVNSRVYSEPAVGETASVGQFFAGIPATFAIAKGEKTSLIGVRQTTPESTSAFRYNYGLVETVGATATVAISAYHQANGYLRTITVDLRPYEAKQWNVSNVLDGGNAWNSRLDVEVTDGDGKVIAFGSGLANTSNDPSTFEMQFADELLSENSPGLNLPFSGSASAESAAAFEVSNTATSGGTGIIGRGVYGGSFVDSGGTSDATLAVGDNGGTGIWASGTVEGGYFEDKDASGQAWVARGDRGIDATGTVAGGAFWTPGDVSSASVATPSSGIEAFGPLQGAIFGATDQSASAWVAGGGIGINAIGTEMGAYFQDIEETSSAYVASGTTGVSAFGEEAGGHFVNTTDESTGYLGHNGHGVEGFGIVGGGYFGDTDGSGQTWAGDGDRGLTASGNEKGGHFEDADDGTWTSVAEGTSSTAGNGAKSFVQNHPYDATRVIVYTALEGDEVGTYTRGTARLIGGEARVALGETFQWVTNPDIGVTVQLTPIGSWSQLYVAERSTSELVVRSADGDANALFDYLVMGLRIGFEEASVVRERRRDAPIPSMASVRARYESEPELRQFTALERFLAVRGETGEAAPLDQSAADALREAIGRVPGPAASAPSAGGDSPR